MAFITTNDGEKIPGAIIEFFEEAGHMLFWDEPDHFNRAVADFVNNG
jgi:pimeloyl-ACP methyl ester carboxylesterase